MNTLQEIGAFVGIPQGAAARQSAFQTTLQLSGKLVSLLHDQERSSMRAMILALGKLPPVTLDAQLVSASHGREPFTPVVRLQPSASAIQETLINYIKDGNVPLAAFDVYAESGDFARTSLGPGSWLISVTRAGVGNAGFVRLERTFPVLVSATPAAPSPSPPAPSPPFGSSTSATCMVEMDGHQPGFGGVGGVRVYGGGFLPSEIVEILQNGLLATTTEADVWGGYNVHLGLIKARLPVQHTFRARSQRTGRVSNEAGYTV